MNKLSASYVILLGLAQDAGVPQIGCQCQNCRSVDSNAGWPVSIAIVDDNACQYWIIDATPRFPEQFNWLKRRYPDYKFSGLLLTHAHIGHYTGLMYLGREAMSAQRVPVYASESMQTFLSDNGPWSALIELENIAQFNLHDKQAVSLSSEITVTPIAVSHRSEFSDTFAMLVTGPKKSLFYCPDIDHWRHLDLSAYLTKKDFALLDATFFSEQELPGRDLSEIPHPLVTQTLEFVAGQSFQTSLIHLNHSNPLWQQGKHRQLLKEHHVLVPDFGTVWLL